jgi:hypothetical protein
MKDIIRRNITRRASEGLCRLQVCYTCNFMICKHFLWLREIVDERCPQYKAVDWYKEAPRYKRVDKCEFMYNRVIIVVNCCVHVQSTLCLVNAQSSISGLL